MCHDHWKSYYQFTECTHSLCNAHHLRELEYAWEMDQQRWTQKMQAFLKSVNETVNKNGGVLSASKSRVYRQQYRQILLDADIECPAPKEETKPSGRRGIQARSKSRNLLERLRNYEGDVLRFMDEVDTPVTNNQAESDIRMIKVQQKISGCVRSFEGAENFCRIRSYLMSCSKQGVSATLALSLLFLGKLPDIFMRGAE